MSSEDREFKKYLEKQGVIDIYTKALVSLYEEKERPQNAIEYIRKCFGKTQDEELLKLKKENEELKKEIEELNKLYKL
jgi:cell division protein FtsB